MKTQEIARLLGGQIAVQQPEREISTFYAGDFLSRVMGRAPGGCGWLTVMGHLNVAGVATLAEVGAVIVCEGVQPAPELVARLMAEGIALLTTPLDVFAAAAKISEAMRT